MNQCVCELSVLNRFTDMLFCILVVFGSVNALQGATRTWDGSYGIYWSAPQNWVENASPDPGDGTE